MQPEPNYDAYTNYLTYTTNNVKIIKFLQTEFTQKYP